MRKHTDVEATETDAAAEEARLKASWASSRLDAVEALAQARAGLAEARRFAQAARSAETDRAYAGDWRHFRSWATAQAGMSDYVPADAQDLTTPVPPAVVALYASSLATSSDGQPSFRSSTIARRMAAISVAHKRRNLESPTASPQVREVLSGIRRTLGTAPRQVAPARAAEIRRMVDYLDRSKLPTAAILRDRSLILLGYAAALRRSELVALTRADVEDHDGDLVVTVRRSKTDQEANGARVPVARGRDHSTCPVRALKTWLDFTARDDASGDTPLFRRVNRWGAIGSEPLTDKSVAQIVKRAAEGAGLDPDLYAGHSLRAGFATTAAANGATERQIARVTRHRSMNILRGYIREANLFADSAADKAGL